jgi:transposase
MESYWHPLIPHLPPLCNVVSNFRSLPTPNFSTTRQPKPKSVPAPLLIGIELNPGPKAFEHLSVKERWFIVFLSEENGRNPTQIAKRMGCTRKTVSKILKKERETGDVEDRPRSGRKRKLSTKEEKKIVKKAQKVGARKAAREFSAQGEKKLNEITIRRAMKKHQFFYLKKKKIQKLKDIDKDKRMNYSREMINSDWKLVLFTDEKSFWLGSTSEYAWQKLDDRIEEETEKWTPKLHVWGGIGYYFKSKLYFFEENMNAALYQKILRERLPPTPAPDCPRTLKKKWYFLQDNDPKHKSKKSMELVRELTEDRFYKHPPYSPDFNVMEDVWSYLDRKVRESKVTSIRGLKKKLTELWNQITWDQFRVNVDSMPTRLQQCLDRNGARTDY